MASSAIEASVVVREQKKKVNDKEQREASRVSHIMPFMPLHGSQSHGSRWELTRRSGSKASLPSRSTSQTQSSE